MAPSEAGAHTGPMTGRDMPEDVGGDPVCWLNRVCENCGRFIGDEFADRCEHCGAARYEDAPAVEPEPEEFPSSIPTSQTPTCPQ